MISLALALAVASAQPIPSPSVDVNMLEARTHPDTHWYGERAYLFRAAGITQHNLEGHTVTWTLDVKRKLQDWKTAKSWLLAKQKIAPNEPVPDVSFGLIYRSMAKAKMQPGEHVARFKATDEYGHELFSREVPFNLPAAGPNAYNPREFK
jgi:hypothetical protein